MTNHRRLAFQAWLCVATKFAAYALAFENGKITGGAPYGMRVIGRERDVAKVRARLERMGARCVVLPAPAGKTLTGSKR